METPVPRHGTGSEVEVLVFLVAHEAFHYLRKTRQVEDRPGEIEARTFALKMLEQYRDVMNIDRQSTDTWSSVRWSHDLGMVLH